MRYKKIDFTGNQFGRLRVVEKTLYKRHGKTLYRCLCVCGTEKLVKSSLLTSGTTRSCGCLNKEQIKKIKKFSSHRMSGKKIYWIWSSMIQRCTNPKNKNYRYYGARGISVSEDWLKFENFFSDMGNPPTNLTLDRINNDGNYEKGNCRWTTRKIQSQNRRKHLSCFMGLK